MGKTVVIEHRGPFRLVHVDMQLDDLCDYCGTYYCRDCEDADCPGVIERCVCVPCLDCAVFEVRRKCDLAVNNTTGTTKTKRR